MARGRPSAEGGTDSAGWSRAVLVLAIGAIQKVPAVFQLMVQDRRLHRPNGWGCWQHRASEGLVSAVN